MAKKQRVGLDETVSGCARQPTKTGQESPNLACDHCSHLEIIGPRRHRNGPHYYPGKRGSLRLLQKYRTTSSKTVKRRNQRVPADMSEPDTAQDPAFAKRRQYYMSWHRAELVDEQLRVQQERDRFQEQWLDASDNLLQWQL